MPLSPHVPDLIAMDMLLSVARLGSLAKAAEEHGVSQPAVSSRVRTMERLLGLTLIDRTSHGSRLTPDGTLVVDWAREIIDAASSFERGANALRTQQEGELRVAASMTIAEYLVPGWLVTAHHELPRLRVSLTLANSTEVAERVLSGAADLGFVEGPDKPPGLRCRTVAHDRLEVVVAPDHHWARRRRPVSASELAATPLIQRERGSGTRYTLAHAMEGLETVAPVLELTSTTAIKAAVANGLAPAVISSLTVASDLAAHRLVPIPIEGIDLTRQLRVVWASSHTLRGPAREFFALVCQGSKPRKRTTAPRSDDGQVQ